MKVYQKAGIYGLLLVMLQFTSVNQNQPRHQHEYKIGSGDSSEPIIDLLGGLSKKPRQIFGKVMHKIKEDSRYIVGIETPNDRLMSLVFEESTLKENYRPDILDAFIDQGGYISVLLDKAQSEWDGIIYVNAKQQIIVSAKETSLEELTRIELQKSIRN
ncbi:hypothetical protein HYS31_07745 [Candidatus Woesearchaeota archaeon]|nr:hypothetical protein [Candidatus Woesearchaeota archaeon]